MMDRRLRNLLYFCVGFSLVTASMLTFAQTAETTISGDGRVLTVLGIFFAAFLGFRTGYRP